MNYTNKTRILQSDLIYIDTSSLLETDRLERFIKNYGSFFRESQKTLFITKDVCHELMKHLSSNDQDKSRLAGDVLNIIRQNTELFDPEISFTDSTESDRKKAFADKDFHMLLSYNMPQYSQLLITNDKALASDAYSLGKRQSFPVHPIYVYYLDPSGDLRLSDSAMSDRKTSIRLKRRKDAPQSSQDPVDDTVYIPTDESKTANDSKQDNLRWLLLGGFLVAAYDRRKDILKHIYRFLQKK